MELKKLRVLIFISEIVISCTSYADGFLNHGLYIYKSLALRGEFKHSDYSGNLVVNRGADFAPSDNMVTLGLLYLF